MWAVADGRFSRSWPDNLKLPLRCTNSTVTTIALMSPVARAVSMFGWGGGFHTPRDRWQTSRQRLIFSDTLRRTVGMIFASGNNVCLLLSCQCSCIGTLLDLCKKMLKIVELSKCFSSWRDKMFFSGHYTLRIVDMHQDMIVRPVLLSVTEWLHIELGSSRKNTLIVQ